MILGEIFDRLKKSSPLIYSITNYVTANDCANALLAVGASPIMSDEIEEAKELCEISNALNINIGTITLRTFETMREAGKYSNVINHPVVLDPVGAGATKFRTECAKKLIKEIKFTAIKGNISEICTLAWGDCASRGVDADEIALAQSLKSRINTAKKFAEKSGSVVVISGKTDVVTDGKRTYSVYNGDALMSRITGTGCMLNALIAAFCAVENNILAVLGAVCTMGLCGEKASIRLDKEQGNAAFRNLLIDELYNLTPEKLEECAKYERL